MWTRELGKGERRLRNGTGIQGGIRLSGKNRRCEPGLGGAHAWAAQVCENFGNHRGIFNGGEDGQRPAALRTDGDVDREDSFE